MDDAKAQLLRWIDEDRDESVGFLCDFVRAKSPNPPGETTQAAAHITRFLERNQLPFRVIAPQPTMPNIVGSFEGGQPGPHLVLKIGPSGGGYGDPRQRAPERVLRDVRDGYISAEMAARDYGVIITADLALDREATARARAGA
jgi:xanthine/CO dehydrogenase XdhC/CoxF family maturation factor